MKRIIICIVIVFGCLLSACEKEPELLEPLGFNENSMEVVRGDMYNIYTTENVVNRETETIYLRSNGIIKEVKVALGDKVSTGDVLVALDGDTVTSMAEDIDAQIAQLEADNEYMNQLKQIKIEIEQLEYDQMLANGASKEELSEKKSKIIDIQNSYYQSTTEQEKTLAELRLQKFEGGNVDSEIVSPCDGVVLYLSNWNTGETISKDTIIAVIGKDNTKVIQGDYLEEEFIESCDEFYAFINGNRYEITNNPLDPNMLAHIDVFGGILQNTYFINSGADEIPYGALANVIFIKDKKENVLYIPDEGLFNDIDGYYVYVKNEAGEKIRRDVEIGFVWNTAVEIISGLEEGEIIYGK